MDWQQIVALTIVMLTAGLFVRARLKRRSTRTVCGSQCGCSGPPPAGPKASVTYRARKGERPQIITRMQ
jgi:hypothetical protein